MELYKYGQIEVDHLKRRDKKLGVAIDRIGAIERGLSMRKAEYIKGLGNAAICGELDLLCGSASKFDPASAPGLTLPLM